jgi:hypothetical protein
LLRFAIEHYYFAQEVGTKGLRCREVNDCLQIQASRSKPYSQNPWTTYCLPEENFHRVLLPLMATYRDKPQNDTFAEDGNNLSSEQALAKNMPLEVECEESLSVTTSAEPEHAHHYLGVLPLAMIVFYNVSGGPFGIEESVRSAGYFVSILGFLIFPLVWSVPEAMVTAELGSAYPEASGGVAWVEEAFGSAAGWQAGFLGWVAGATDSE